MAIDTRDKRASVLGYQHPIVRVFPNPDASLANAADRQHIALVYSGINTGSAAEERIRRLRFSYPFTQFGSPF